MNTLEYPQWPAFPRDAIDAVVEVLESGRTNQWGGEHVYAFEEAFADYVGANHGIAVSNGTVAIEVALRAIGLERDDEVIVTPRTFIASASAIVMCGGVPVFVDVDSNTQNIDPRHVAAAVSPRTRAIICVHHAGCPCDMDALSTIARDAGLKLVEDCAQAHGAEYRGRKAGVLGDVAAFSFCQDKIMTTGGEGGFITTNDESIWHRAWSLKDHGKSWDKMQDLQPQPRCPLLCDGIGSNYRMTEMQAAIGRHLVPKLDEWVARRRDIARQLDACFSTFEFIRVPEYENHLYHARYEYYVFIEPAALPEDSTCFALRAALQEAGIRCNAGSCSEVQREIAFAGTPNLPEQLPVADELRDTSIKLSISPAMDDSFVAALCDRIHAALEGIR